jgi:ribose/xylose/arabinose/galactoside ABC-type transport system permease subunit
MEGALYACSGLLAGLVAIPYTARGGAVIPDAGTGIELQTIACVVLGGTRVTGGFGGVGRTLLGLAILAHLDIGLQLLGTQRFSVPWRESPIQIDAQGRLILVGLLLVVLAVVNERLVRRADD